MARAMDIVDCLRALADPTRLRVVRLLASMELAVGELAQVLAQSQPRVSRHVKILCDAGLAERRREGSWVFVSSRIAGGSGIGRALAALLDCAELEDEEFARHCADDRARLQAIKDARNTRAADYFAAHARQWDSLRALLCDPASVEQALVGALGGAGLGELLDIGTGTGRIAELLADRAAHVTALDRSPDMLALARARLQTQPQGHVELVQADFAALPFGEGVFDTVTLHQVLHYAHAPRTVLAEAARVTRAGGRIAIVDLAAHDREELRSEHAHARLGFTDEEMERMLAEAGFESGAPLTLNGGELTIKVWTGIRQPLSAMSGPQPPLASSIPSLSL